MQYRHSGLAHWRPVLWVTAGQLVVASASAAAFCWSHGRQWAVAAFAGGGISVLTGLFFASAMFTFSRGGGPQRMLGAVYIAEIFKWALTVVMFSLTAVEFREQFLAVILTFILTLFVYWVALLLQRPETPASRSSRRP